MFNVDSLSAHIGEHMEINGEWFVLTKNSEIVSWISESYKVYATPNFENVPVPVEVITQDERFIGKDSYPADVETYDRYCHVVRVLVEKILRRARK